MLFSLLLWRGLFWYLFKVCWKIMIGAYLGHFSKSVNPPSQQSNFKDTEWSSHSKVISDKILDLPTAEVDCFINEAIELFETAGVVPNSAVFTIQSEDSSLPTHVRPDFLLFLVQMHILFAKRKKPCLAVEAYCSLNHERFFE